MSRLVLLVALASGLLALGKPTLETIAARGTELPPCSPEGYGLEEQYVRPTNQPQEAVKLTAGWLTAKEKRRKCLLQTTIRLTIRGSGGVAAEAEWTVNSVRRPWSGIVHTWVWQNWCEASQGGATVELSDPSGSTVQPLIPDPPACVNPDAPTTVADLGTGTKYVTSPGDRFPPHLLPKGAPPALPPARLEVKNAWLVSDGYTLVAVYAGSPGKDPAIGRLAIIRQNEIFGVQYAPPDIVNVGRTGAVKITRWPQGRSHETTAQWGKLSFVAADGTKGVLELKGDHIRITARPSKSSRP